MIAINKEARQRIIELYNDANESDKELYVQLGQEFGFDVKTGRVNNEESRDIDERLDLLDAIIDNRCENEGAENTVQYLKEFDITDEQLERWGYDVPEDDKEYDEPYDDYHSDDNAEYDAMKAEEARYINGRR